MPLHSPLRFDWLERVDRPAGERELEATRARILAALDDEPPPPHQAPPLVPRRTHPAEGPPPIDRPALAAALIVATATALVVLGTVAYALGWF
jgi:hypothetical protein